MGETKRCQEPEGRLFKTTDAHEVAYQEIVALIQRHADKVSAIELLGIAANMVGKLVALQDQRAVTPEMAMEIVAKNIEFGNETVRRGPTESASGRPN